MRDMMYSGMAAVDLEMLVLKLIHLVGPNDGGSGGSSDAVSMVEAGGDITSGSDAGHYKVNQSFEAKLLNIPKKQYEYIQKNSVRIKNDEIIESYSNDIINENNKNHHLASCDLKNVAKSLNNVNQLEAKKNILNIVDNLQHNFEELRVMLKNISEILDIILKQGEFSLFNKLCNDCVFLELDLTQNYMQLALKSNSKNSEFFVLQEKLFEYTGKQWNITIEQNFELEGYSYCELCKKFDKIMINQMLQKPLIRDIISLVEGVQINNVTLSELNKRLN
jgi:hypothetical protein